jgi:hypothetical protein
MGLDKYEKKELAKINIAADDISLYPQRMARGKITYGGASRGERKNLPIKVRLVETEGRPPQFILELQGNYHVEDLSYFVSDPDSWISYGKLWLSLEDARKLAKFITDNNP